MMGSISSLLAMAQEKAAEAAQAAAGAAQELQRTDVDGRSFWLPPEVTTNTSLVDNLFYWITALAIFCFVGITIAVVYFTIKYRRRPGSEAEPSPHHSDKLEITWTVIPSIICVFIFVFAWRGYVDFNTPPKHALEIGVTGQKWSWTFSYPNGWQDTTLHVPVDKPVRLVMKSTDVLHSFYVPAFRVKQDLVPNRYTRAWFQAKEAGVYRLYCAEYCGQGHSAMKTLVQVHEPGGYEKYLEQAEEQAKKLALESPVEAGQKLYEDKGCKNCHSTDGTPGTGPTFKGIFGETHNFTDGTSLAVDENYIRESILEPQAKVRAGFNPVMPTFKGQLKDWQIDTLISFIKSLK